MGGEGTHHHLLRLVIPEIVESEAIALLAGAIALEMSFQKALPLAPEHLVFLALFSRPVARKAGAVLKTKGYQTFLPSLQGQVSALRPESHILVLQEQ
jgi:hypothetical protein